MQDDSGIEFGRSEWNVPDQSNKRVDGDPSPETVKTRLDRTEDDDASFEYVTSISLWIGLGFAVTAAFGTCLYLLGLDDWFDRANLYMPLAMGLFAALGAFSLFRKKHILVLIPIMFLFVAVLLYPCVGSLLYSLGNDNDIAYCDEFYAVTPVKLLLVNILNSFSISLLLVSHGLVLNWVKGYFKKRTSVNQDSDAIRVLMLYATVGIGVKYGLLFPIELGLVTFVPPGVLGGVVLFSSLTVMMLFYLHVKNIMPLNFFTFVFICADMLHVVLQGSKLVLLIHLSLICFGIFLARPSRWMLVGFAIFLSIVYYYAADYVSVTRELQLARQDFSLRARFDILMAYCFDDGIRDELGAESEYTGWWVRLNYVPSQAFAMNEYDHGTSGDTYMLLVYSFVPRSLFPDKPLITPGAKFHYLATGSSTSQSAPGIFGEAYWNGGWPLVFCTAIYVGGLLACFTAGTIRNSGEFDFVWLPCLFQSFLLGVRIDDWFVATYVAAIVILLCYYWTARSVMGMINRI